MSDPAPLLTQMAVRSRRKLTLPKNLAKGPWWEMTDFQVRQAVRDEMEELAVELGFLFRDGHLFPTTNIRGEPIDWEKIADEAADVYHFASMGADPVRRGLADRPDPVRALTCPNCGEPMVEHTVSEFGEDQVDVWSEPMGNLGMVCFTLPKGVLPV